MRKGKQGFYIQYNVSVAMFKCKTSRITLGRPKNNGAQSTSSSNPAVSHLLI